MELGRQKEKKLLTVKAEFEGTGTQDINDNHAKYLGIFLPAEYANFFKSLRIMRP